MKKTAALLSILALFLWAPLASAAGPGPVTPQAPAAKPPTPPKPPMQPKGRAKPAKPAPAPTPDQALEKARRLAGEGKWAPALDSAEQAVTGLWQKAPFTLGRHLLVTAPAPGYGMYIPRRHNKYKASGNEPIRIYLEPRGFSWVRQEKGVFKIGMTIDLYLLDSKGKVLSGKKNFQKLNLYCRNRAREMLVNVTLNLSGAPPGKYVIKLVGHDLGKKGSAEVRLPITLN